MKIKIVYEYDTSIIAPYVVWVTSGTRRFCSVSAVSYEAAKEKAIKILQSSVEVSNLPPDPEEIEVEL